MINLYLWIMPLNSKKGFLSSHIFTSFETFVPITAFLEWSVCLRFASSVHQGPAAHSPPRQLWMLSRLLFLLEWTAVTASLPHESGDQGWLLTSGAWKAGWEGFLLTGAAPPTFFPTPPSTPRSSPSTCETGVGSYHQRDFLESSPNVGCPVN